MRFPGFEGEWELKKLSAYLYENKERNRNGEFNKSDVLSVSGDCGIVNQIELLGRSFAGKSVADYHVVRTDDIVYTKSPLKEYPYGIVKYNNGQDGIVSTLYAVYHHKDNVDGQFVEYYFTNPQRTNRYFKPIVRIGAKHDMKIGNEEVLDSFVVFPGLEEQRKITEMLSLLDLRIAIQNKVKEVISKTVPYSEDTLFKNIPEDIRTLYEKFRDGILELDSEIIIKFTKLYAAFKKNGSNVCDLEPFKGSLCIFINSEKGSLRDGNGLAVDVSNLGHHGNGDYRIQIRDADQYEYILSLIKQAIK